ncbi:MAG: DNA double-strand break repair nuclease NurA [Thermocladium sp.]
METSSIDFWIDPPLLLSIFVDVKNIVEKMKGTESSNIINEVKALLGDRVKPIMEAGGELKAYAIDSSYADPALELVGGVLTVVAYGYVGNTGNEADKFVTGTVFFEDTNEVEKTVAFRSSIMERELAVKLMNEKKRGSRKLDLIVLDGDIALHPLPYNLPSKRSERSVVEKTMKRLLKEAAATGTTIVGVVKRVRSKYVSALMGKCLPVNDKLLMSMMLDRGQYIELGTFGELLPKWVEVNYLKCWSDEEYLRKRRFEEGRSNLEAVFNSELGSLKGVEVAFYKAMNSAIATKIEVLDFGGLGLDKVIGFLAGQTTNTGYPYILDTVDTVVRIDTRLLDYVRTLLIRNASEVSSDLINALLQLTNPQKAYLYKQLEA